MTTSVIMSVGFKDSLCSQNCLVFLKIAKQLSDGIGALYHTQISGILVVVTAGTYTAKRCWRGEAGVVFLVV